jgi:hypothetical protein
VGLRMCAVPSTPACSQMMARRSMTALAFLAVVLLSAFAATDGEARRARGGTALRMRAGNGRGANAASFPVGVRSRDGPTAPTLAALPHSAPAGTHVPERPTAPRVVRDRASVPRGPHSEGPPRSEDIMVIAVSAVALWPRGLGFAISDDVRTVRILNNP